MNTFLTRATGVLAALVLFAAGAVEAQQTGNITGRVVDQATGQPLAGAQVVLVGTTRGIVTNQEGRYLLNNVAAGQRQVRVVLIGYSQETQTVSVPAGGTATADFSLEQSAVQLDAIVVNAVTGRESRARELGTNVSTIQFDEEIEQSSITNFAEALMGRSEGVFVQDVNGSTGTSQKIRIRGANSLSLSNEPLIYVDGVPYSTNDGGFGVGGQEPSRLNDLNPNDIESVEILKGPAASALYGTAAANGVILITTKRGAVGDARWSAYAERGWLEDETDYPLNYLSYQINDPSLPLIRDNGSFNTTGYSYCPNRSAAAGTCTQDATMTFQPLLDPRTTPFQTGNRERFGVSVQGGSESVSYFVSGDMEDEMGVISMNALRKYGFRANVDGRIGDNFTVGVTTGYTDSHLELNNNDNSIFSSILNGITGSAWYAPPLDCTDGPGCVNGQAVNWRNYGFGFTPAELELLPFKQEVDRLTIGVNTTYRPLEWLSANVNLGLDYFSRHDHETLQPDDLPIAYSYTIGYRASTRANNYLYNGNASLQGSYDVMEDLISTTTVGANYQRSLFENTECYGAGITPGSASCGATSQLFDVDEAFSEIVTVGGFVQEEIAWRDRVFVAAALRGDDNSAFGTDFGFVWYPSFNVSWVIAEEDFFPRLDWLNTLRLRGAYGTSGLRPGFRDAVTLFSPVAVRIDGSDESGVTINSTGNEALEPERSTEWELGFDAGFLDNRLGVDFTYFNKESEDALVERQLPPSLGLSTSRWENLGSIRNKGTELALNALVLDRPDYRVNLTFTNTTLDNEVLSIGAADGVEDITLNRGQQRHAEGYTAGGFWQQPYTFTDADGDGRLTNSDVTVASDAVFIGPVLPEWQRTFTAEVTLFDFVTLRSLIEGKGGHYQIDYSENFRCGFDSRYGCPAVGSPDATLEQQAAHIADRYLGSGYGFIHPADFYRWREASLSIGMPQYLSDRVPQLSGARLTVAGRNLAIWTDYPGIDPEANESGGSSNFTQGEFNTQPPIRTITLRLDVTF